MPVIIKHAILHLVHFAYWYMEEWLNLFDGVLSENDSIRQPCEEELLNRMEQSKEQLILACINIFTKESYTERARSSAIIYLAKVLSTERKNKLRNIRRLIYSLEEKTEGELKLSTIEDTICMNVMNTNETIRNKCIEIFASLFNIERSNFLSRFDPFMNALENGTSEDMVIVALHIFRELFYLPNWDDIVKTDGFDKYYIAFVQGCVNIVGHPECSLPFRVEASNFVYNAIINIPELITGDEAVNEIFDSASSALSMPDTDLYESVHLILFHLSCACHENIENFADGIIVLINANLEETEPDYIPFHTISLKYWTEMALFEANNQDDFHITQTYYDNILDSAFNFIVLIDSNPNSTLIKNTYSDLNIATQDLMSALYHYSCTDFIQKAGDRIMALSNGENWEEIYGFLSCVCAVSKQKKTNTIKSDLEIEFLYNIYMRVYNLTRESTLPLIIECSLWTLSEFIIANPMIIRMNPSESIAMYNDWIQSINLDEATPPMIIIRYLRVILAINDSQIMDSEKNILSGIYESDIDFLFLIYNYPDFAKYTGIKSLTSNALNSFIKNAPKSLNPHLSHLMDTILKMLIDAAADMSNEDSYDRISRLISNITKLTERLNTMLPYGTYDMAIEVMFKILETLDPTIYSEALVCLGYLIAGRFRGVELDYQCIEQAKENFRIASISSSPEVIKSGCIMIFTIYQQIYDLVEYSSSIIEIINNMVESENDCVLSPAMPFIIRVVSIIIKRSFSYEEINEDYHELVKTIIASNVEKEFDTSDENGNEEANQHYDSMVHIFNTYRKCFWSFMHEDVQQEKEFLKMIILLSKSLLNIPLIYDSLMVHHCHFLQKCARDVSRKNCLLLNRSFVTKVLETKYSATTKTLAEDTKLIVRHA